jgi:cell division protein FtsL
MKHLLLILIIGLISFNGLSQTNAPDLQKNSQINAEPNSQQSDRTSILEKRVETLERNDTFFYSALGVFFAVVSVIFILLQWYFSVKAENNVYKRLAKLANQDKEAFRASLKQKSVEVELQTYPLIIVSDEKSQEVKELQRLLREYEFEHVGIEQYNEVQKKCDGNKLTKRHILIFCKGHVNKDSSAKILSYQKKLQFGIFGYGRKEELENLVIPKDCDPVNFANSYASIYNNLLSLLHYKRYSNNKRVAECK